MERRLPAGLVPVVAVVLALVVGAGLMLAAGKNPLDIYGRLFGETLGTAYGIGQVLGRATPLIFTGLAVALGFRAGLFNIGAEGQMTAGGFAAAMVGATWETGPSWLLLPLGLVAAAAAGALVAMVPGWLRAKRGAHEVVTSIMMNFVTAAVVGSLLVKVAVPATVHTETLPEQARLPRLGALLEHLGLDTAANALRSSPANLTFVLALVAAACVAFGLFRTSRGFELRAMGANPTAAATAGVELPRRMFRTFLTSGALAGLAGTSFVLGGKYYYETGFAAGAGFMGIAVALVGRNHPFGIVLSALLFGALAQGGLVVNADVPAEIVTVLQALTILFLVAGLGRSRA